MAISGLLYNEHVEKEVENPMISKVHGFYFRLP